MIAMPSVGLTPNRKLNSTRAFKGSVLLKSQLYRKAPSLDYLVTPGNDEIKENI